MKLSRSAGKKQRGEPFYDPFFRYQSDEDGGKKTKINPSTSNLRFFTGDPLMLEYWDFATGPTCYSNFWERLRSLWHQAERFLFFFPIDGDNLVTEADLNRYVQGDLHKKLTDAQKNALHVLRCVRKIQDYFYPDQPIYKQDSLEFDPINFQTKDSRDAHRKRLKRKLVSLTPEELEKRMSGLLAEFGLRVMHLAMASMNCDFHGLLWPYAENRQQHQGKITDRAVEEKQRRAKLRLHIVEEHAQQYLDRGQGPRAVAKELLKLSFGKSGGHNVFGHGPKDKTWKVGLIYKDILKLIRKRKLVEKP